jgi:hypothetical protein
VKDNNYGGCGEKAGIHLKQRDLVRPRYFQNHLLSNVEDPDPGNINMAPKTDLKRKLNSCFEDLNFRWQC